MLLVSLAVSVLRATEGELPPAKAAPPERTAKYGWVCEAEVDCVIVVLPTVVCAITVEKVFVPPLEAVPETTRNALSLWVVCFVQYVGAAVCWKSINVPVGNGFDCIAGWQMNTSLVPAPKFTAAPALLLARIVVLVSVLAALYVPIPVSQAEPGRTIEYQQVSPTLMTALNGWYDVFGAPPRVNAPAPVVVEDSLTLSAKTNAIKVFLQSDIVL